MAKGAFKILRYENKYNPSTEPFHFLFSFFSFYKCIFKIIFLKLPDNHV